MKDKYNRDSAPVGGLGTEISALFSGIGIEFELPELRGYELRNDLDLRVDSSAD
jgi:hypothetical protein